MPGAAALFAQSLLIGVSIAAPVGPIGLLVIQRTLERGRAVGLATGLGAAVADALYGAVGAFGVTSLIAVLQGLRVPLALGGGAFLLWLAWRTWHAEPAASAAAPRADARGLAGCFAGTLLLTLSNPATIFSFIAIFGALGARGPVTSPWPMIAGVLLGSALWWLVLSTGVGALRERFDGHWRRRVNRVSAGLLAALALWPLADLVAPAG
jgi:threonine/homoserine/homoserine lactone efflux protein